MNRVALALLAVTAVALPFVASDYVVVLALRALMYSLIVMSFGLLAGQLGLVSLLQSTLAGIAGYGLAILSTRYGWSPGPAALASLLLTLASAAVFGLFSLKAGGVGFMMLTIALGQMVWALSLQWIDLFKGMDGIVSIPTPAGAGFDLRDPRAMYAVTAVVVAASFGSAHVLIRSRLGLLMRGIQDNAPRMRALGHPVLQARLACFLLASLYAGLGGILLTWETRVITPVTLDLSRAVWVLTAAVIGGTTLAGSAIGVVIMVALEAVLSQYTDRHVLVFGLILALAILVLPNGIAAYAADLRAKRRGRTRGPTALQLSRAPGSDDMRQVSWIGAVSLIAIAAAIGGPAGAQEELRVGVIGNLSGVFAASGTTMVNGIRMAVDEAGGKVGNMTIKLFVVDDEGNPELAITRLKAMDSRDKVDVVVGPASGNIGMAAVDWAKDSGVPVVVAYSAPEDITMRKAVRNVVRAGWSGAQPMFAFGEYIAKKGIKKVVMVGQDYVFPHNQIGGFLKTFCRNGGEEVVKIWHPLNTTDFSSMLAVLPAGDAILYNGAGSDGVAFAKQLDEFGARRGRPLLGGSNFFAVGSLPAMGKSALGGLSALQYSDALDTPEFKTFRDAYVKTYNEPPMATSEHGYVAMKMVLNAVTETGGKDRAKMIEALRRTDMPGAPRGPVKLDDYGNPIQNIYINEVKEVGGKMLNVAIAKVEKVSQFGPYDAKTYLADPPDSRDFPPGKCSDPYYKK